MGPGRDKAMEIVAGQTALSRVVGVLAASCGDVVVVATPGQSLPTIAAPGRRTDDPAESARQGPLRGLATGLEQLADAGIETAYLAACDSITVSTPHVEFMFAALDAEPEVAAVVPVSEGDHAHPLAAVVRVVPARDAAHALLAQGRRAARALLSQLSTRQIDAASLPDPRVLLPTNTPEQWADATRALERS
jgi:molybdopterin-guanine dinucleotide biosynthesis protein A